MLKKLCMVHQTKNVCLILKCVMKDSGDVFDVANNLQCGIVCFIFLFFYLFYLFPAKTEVCLDSLIPGLEPPQAQLHPVEADPVSSALGGKKYAFETDKPLSSILAPCQILQWLQNIFFVWRVGLRLWLISHIKISAISILFPHIFKDPVC